MRSVVLAVDGHAQCSVVLTADGHACVVLAVDGHAFVLSCWPLMDMRLFCRVGS